MIYNLDSYTFQSSIVQLRSDLVPIRCEFLTWLLNFTSMAQCVLITGGAGYIGSHTVLQLLLGGYKTVVIDNLDNSSQVAINRVRELAGDRADNLIFHKVCVLVLFPPFWILVWRLIWEIGFWFV